LNKLKKLYWVLGTTGIIIAILIITLFILPGTKEGSVSNLYIIPAGIVSPFHDTNAPMEQNVTVPGERVIASFGLDGNNPDRTVFINNPDLTERFLNASEADISIYYYPKGPVIGYGKDMRGSVVVMMDDSQNVNLTVVSEIHDRISARGRTFNITNVPCKFVLTGIVEVGVPKDMMP
jgi:hypothetical protein